MKIKTVCSTTMKTYLLFPLMFSYFINKHFNMGTPQVWSQPYVVFKGTSMWLHFSTHGVATWLNFYPSLESGAYFSGLGTRGGGNTKKH